MLYREVGIPCAGTGAIARSHPKARRIEARYSFVTCTPPGLAVLLAVVLLPRVPTSRCLSYLPATILSP
jgi:hypothetical protein